MKKGILLTVGSLAAIGVAYVFYKKTVPPPFTVRAFSPETMDGNFEWGKASGSLTTMNATFSAGWGWDAKITPDATKKQYDVAVTKNGKTYKTIIVNGTGSFKV